jgi:hypothetical protein
VNEQGRYVNPIPKCGRQSSDTLLALENIVALVFEGSDGGAISMSNAYGRLTKVTVAEIRELSLSFAGVVRWSVNPSSVKYLRNRGSRRMGGTAKVRVYQVSGVADIEGVGTI